MQKFYSIIIVPFVILKICTQPLRYTFFDYKQDSLKSRTVMANAPANSQTFSVGNSFITDYVGNTRISVLTGVVTGKKDTFLAMHSLFNGAGNLAMDAEIPLGLLLLRKKKIPDFVGLSLHPRISTLLNSSNTFEKSMLSYDLGLNLTTRITGDLGNIAIKFTIRNALCFGNNQFITRTFQFARKDFYYSAAMMRIRAGTNVFSLNYPIFLWSPKRKSIQNLPVFAGYTLQF